GVADVEVNAYATEPRAINESAKVVGTAHFAQSVFHAKGDAGVMRVQDQMLERTESRVALARIGAFTRAAHVQDEPRIGQIIRDVNHALQFIHGLDAPDALHFANGKRRTALAHGAQIPAGGCV